VPPSDAFHLRRWCGDSPLLRPAEARGERRRERREEWNGGGVQNAMIRLTTTSDADRLTGNDSAASAAKLLRKALADAAPTRQSALNHW
jgi:hypothetical protein